MVPYFEFAMANRNVSGCLQSRSSYPAACKVGSGWEMVPNVHRLIEVGHAISYTVHREYGLCVPIITVCASTVGGTRTNHALRQPWRPCRSGRENVVSGARVEEQQHVPQAPVSSLCHA